MAKEPKPPKHWHNQSCFETKQVCFKIEHTHTSGCHGQRGTVTCGTAAHQHTAKCFLQSTTCGHN